jgi:hypothetical protein
MHSLGEKIIAIDKFVTQDIGKFLKQGDSNSCF